MWSDWPIVRLGDYCLKIGSGATPKGGKKAYLDTGPVALIRSQNVLNDGFKGQGLAFISEKQARKLDGVAVESGDVLINITGNSVARVCLAPARILPARVNQHVAIVRPDPSDFDSRFVRYFLLTPVQQKLLLRLADAGGTRNALTKGILENLAIPKPPLDVQKELAEPLHLLEQRIELLRDTNTTLESIAQAIFKAWFIDFDPVRAKAEGREPEGMDAETAALFPGEFEESELGPIPMGWRVSPYSEVLSPRVERVGGESVPEYSATVEGLLPREERFKKQLSKSRKSNKLIRKGDLVFGLSRSVLNFGLMKDPIGSVSPVYEVFQVNTDLFIPEILGMHVRQNMKFHLDILKPGAREGQPIDRLYFLSKTVLIPPMAIQKRFYELAFGENSLTSLVEANRQRAKTLAEIRDTLLPRLISGEFQTPEPQELVEEVLV